MTPRAFRRIAVIALGAMALTHCARNPVSQVGDTVRMTDQQEIQAGAQASLAVLREYAALNNPALQDYVNEVGQRLARQSGRANLPWRFTVLDSADVNAFSLPGGQVYVTRGLLAYLNSEAELAGVIGHEIGHVNARHGLRQPATAAAADSASLGAILMPEAGSQADVGLPQAWTAGYGRDQEWEADRLGAEYLAKAHYNPQAMVAAHGVLQDQAQFAVDRGGRNGGQLRSYHGIFAVSPGDPPRLQQGGEAANRYAADRPRDGRGDYLRKIEGMVFGDSPEQGVIRGHALLHEKLGLAIQFPAGWRVQNRPDRAVATSPDGDARVELVAGPKNDNPMETLQQGVRLDPGARYDSGRLSGYPAAFAAGTQDGRPVVVAAIVFDGSVQYLIAGMTRDTAAYERERSALRAAINSFHAITPAEKLAARPRVLRLVTARPGQTMASFAQQSPLGADAERALRLLNGLYPDGEPKPGQLLKIVR